MAQEDTQPTEQVVPAVQETPLSYADAALAAIDEDYDVSTNEWGDESFSDRSEKQQETVVAGVTQAAPDDAEQQVSDEPATVQPTFDLEQDRQAGFDVDSPLYQAALARLAPDATTQEQNEEAPDTEQVARQDEAATQDEPSFTSPVLEVNFDNFEITRLPPESALAGHEEEIGTIVKDYVRAAVSQVNTQNKTFAADQTLAQTTTFLETIVTEVEKGWGKEKSAEVLGFMKEHPDMARSTPRKFANLACKVLQIDPSNPPLMAKPSTEESPAQPAPARSQPQADPKRIARQVVSRQTRPATPAAPQKGKPKQYSSYTDAVKAALDG